MTNALVVASGIILAAAGPVLILVLNSRNKVRQYVYGTARVADISPRPTTDGRTARGRLKLVVRATGVNGVTVSTVDPAIPLDKWPDAGATLPVQVLKGNPRKLAVVWDKVQSHQDAQASERRPTGGSAPRYSLDGDEVDVITDSPTDEYERRQAARGHGGGGLNGGGPSFERPADDLPPDDRPTLTDLPPITAPVIEPVRLSGRGDRTGQTRPAPRPTSPAPSPGATGAGPTGTTAAVAFAEPGDPAASSGGSAGPSASARPSGSAGPKASAGSAEMVEVAAEQAGARPAHAAVVTEDTPPMVVRLPSSPVRGGARRRPSPRPRPGTHDRGPGRSVQSPAAPAPEETPAVVTEAAPTTYTIPEAGSPLSPPPDLPASDFPAEQVADPGTGPAEAVTMTKPAGTTRTTTGAGPSAGTVPAEVAEVAAGADVAEPATVAEPEAEAAPEAETAVEGGADVPGDRPAGTAALASGITWWPDREMEQLPTRVPRIEHIPVADTDPLPPADPLPPISAGPAPVVVPPTPLRTANEASAATAEPSTEPATDPASTGARDGSADGAATTRPWGAVDANGRPERTTSAWSGNGHSRDAVPLGAGMFGAPPVWPKPATVDDEDDEPVTPDPYATEHYVDDAPEDQLEEQPPSEGAVGQFLATEQRQQSMPLDGVNGVSITLIVSDLDRSRRFYRDTLGLTELDSGEAAAVLATGDARVVLRRVADMPPVDRRVVHLNLEVPDVYEAYERLREQGVDFVHRPRVVPQGEQLELCSATFRDPDGHAIALTKWELRR
ncbi:VOC family protein [Dactylosporangium sp. NBC_01737]|uniref:VOC family protein n=1 Tax=Dactylosporangium sp. NBC_01737 TaxID=2975959 RepID=UPI002E1370A5|nr:VOC family protein [Dactylosporangium sp. NBC_01737]